MLRQCSLFDTRLCECTSTISGANARKTRSCDQTFERALESRYAINNNKKHKEIYVDIALYFTCIICNRMSASKGFMTFTQWSRWELGFTWFSDIVGHSLTFSADLNQLKSSLCRKKLLRYQFFNFFLYFTKLNECYTRLVNIFRIRFFKTDGQFSAKLR